MKTIRHSLEVNFSELNSSFFAVTSSFYFCDVMLFLKGKKEETVFFSHAGTLPKMLCSLHFVTYSHRRNLKEKKSLSRCWVVERVENVLKKIGMKEKSNWSAIWLQLGSDELVCCFCMISKVERHHHFFISRQDFFPKDLIDIKLILFKKKQQSNNLINF